MASDSKNDYQYLISVLEKTRTRLLDKTRRNRLLNYKESARDIAIIDEMPDQVYEHLVLNEHGFYFDPYEEPENSNPQTVDLFLDNEKKGTDRKLPKSTHKKIETEQRYKDNRLQTPFSENELERRLRKLYLNHRTIIEETGANNLYLVAGFLEWNDCQEDSDPNKSYSPLILVPVRLEKERGFGIAKYKMLFDDEAFDTNYSLYEKLKHDFDITLPLLKEEQAPEQYWLEVDKAITSKKKYDWSIVREMTLGLFRFNKQIMWHDLNPKRWPQHAQLIDKPVLKRILLGAEGDDTAPGQLTVDYPQDDIQQEVKVPEFALIRDADSSQYAALIDAFTRKDGLVIEGPPGTGKSQTITNLIASALDQNLSVLFVAEKMAALDVVYRRIEEMGLGDFCLQLHGLKTSKKELLQSVMQRINRNFIAPTQLRQKKQELNRTKRELIEYSKAMTESVGPEDLPLYQVVWRVEKSLQALPEKFQPIDISNPEDVKFETYHRTKVLLDDLCKEWSAIPDKVRDAWKGFLPESYEESHEDMFKAQMVGVLKAIDCINSWFEDHEVSSLAPCLAETSRLLKLALLNTNEALPPFPVGGDMTLAHRISHNELMEPFKEMLLILESYLELVQSVNEVFDYESDKSANYAELLKTNVGRLVNVVCEPNVTVGELSQEKIDIDTVINLLKSMMEIATPVTKLTDKFPRTFDDCKHLVELAYQLGDGPEELSMYASTAHAKASARSYLNQALEQFNVLAQKASQLKMFNLEHIRDTKQLREAHQHIVKNKDNWLAILNSRYRESKRFIRNFMRQPSKFSRKKGFLDKLSKLEDFCRQRDEFTNIKKFQHSLGTLFRGMETDWEVLGALIEFSLKLQQSVGVDNTKYILSDWDSHADRMMRVQDQFNRAIETIDTYVATHPFPESLWQRPVNEIANTLSPWAEKLQIAIDEIEQSWCRYDASLQRTLSAVESYQLAKETESRIELHTQFEVLLRAHWEGASTHVASLRAVYDWIAKLLEIDGVNMDLIKWVIPQPDIFRRDYFVELIEEAKKFQCVVEGQFREFNGFGVLIPTEWIGGIHSITDEFKNKLQRCAETISSLPLMVRWQLLNKQVCEIGLKALADAVSSGQLVGDACSSAFVFSLYSKILKEKISTSTLLKTFTHTRFESLRGRFANLDKEMFQLNAHHIASRLENVAVPEGRGHGPVGVYTEKRLLIHEAGKKKRHIPIRQLVKRSGNALQALKPCFLMSPLSVAQYLAPGDIEFDLVVMDEASQIRPEDALGAIARGRKAIIVGDPKQLPPTSFFDTASVDDSDLEESIIDDTESILDVCLKQFPFRRLRWHYRSQHESLIQFSNESFYNGDLIVFPSPKRESRSFGVYSNFIDNPSYKNGRNRNEAEVVVKNIIHHYRHHREKSLGVAAFNKRQAEEIQLLLDKARNEDPAVDDLIAQHETHDPLFIKNLENVQGDERDVIFISTTYGPEKSGAPVFQRFGPINSDLGWRRLNVIATRARQRVEVFTSMRPTDIRIGDGSRRGVRVLKDYLEYAATGKITEHGGPSGRAPDSEFEEAVSKVLSDLGYECDPQVGVAGFYIDIGVRHPDYSGEYLMGIECDGATYHSARSVRDRDRLRQEILESKGWHIHRIWSTSWFHTRAAEMERLKTALTIRLEEVRKISSSIVSQEAKPEVIELVHQVTKEKLAQEEKEINESLEETLDRFWEQNIEPQFPSRSNSILSKKMIELLVSERPESGTQWFEVIPMHLRQNMEPKQKEFLEDILDIIAEYV